jgi:hypothetical protein
MKIDLDKFNDDVQGWGKVTSKALQELGDAMGIVHRSDSPSKGASLAKIKDSYRQQDGAIAVVRFKFRRSLIYTHKGAGRGMGGSQGSKWLDKFGNEKSTNPSSLGKQATGKRKEKPFINQVLESPEGVDELATIAAGSLGDAIINKMLVK